MASIWQRLQHHPVVPVVWDAAGLLEASRSPVAAVFLQYGSISNLQESCRRLKQARREAKIFFHIDLAEGIAADEAGVRFARGAGVDGILTTKPSLVEAAKNAGLATVLRVFIQDSRSLRRAVQLALRCGPDALDALPGPVVPDVMADLRESLSQPIIAGGLIRREGQVRALLQAGCRAVDTSNQELWALNAVLQIRDRRAPRQVSGMQKIDNMPIDHALGI